MNQRTLAEIREYAVQGDRATMLSTLRSAINEGTIAPRDGVELMLAVRQGSQPVMLEAVDSLKWGTPGAYRYTPKTDYAVA